MKVKKFNGKLKEFDKDKIIESIRAASRVTTTQDMPEFMMRNIANDVEEVLVTNNTSAKFITTEQIAKTVEDILMTKKYKDIARTYIIYHYDAQKTRVYNTEIIKAFEKKLGGDNIENSNANCDERSFSGRMNEAARVLLKETALKMMSKTFRDNHINNEVYTHDLDSWAAGEHNCLSIPFDNMFKDGVHIKQTDIRSPKSISTSMQLIAVYMQVQSLQQFGGVAATHLDWTLIPSLRHTFFKHLKDGKKYLKHINDWIIPENCEDLSIDDYIKDPCYKYAIDMTKRDALQGAEALIHNLNSLQSRSGQQLPFSSINYGTCTLTEGRIITNAILDATLNGTGPLKKTPIFPCGIFQYDDKINGQPNTPNYDLFLKALKCTAKRFYPNYTNVNWSVDLAMRMKDVEHKRAVLSKLSEDKMKTLVGWVLDNSLEAYKYKMVLNEDKTAVIIDENIVNPVEIMSTMGCRTYNGYDANFDFKYIIDHILKYDKPPKNYFYSGNQKDGRGNIAPATIIMPTLAMEAKGAIGNKDVEDFFDILLRKMEECKESLVERFTHIASQSPASAAFMYQNKTMLGYIPKEGIISALKHGTLAIGQIGLAETLQILIGKDHTTPEGMEIAKRIEALFNKKCSEYKAATYHLVNEKAGLDVEVKLNFGVYYTPAESLCHTALTKFRKKYGEIPNVSDKEFFTNSIHVPVWYDLTPFEKIDIEAQLTGYSNAGCITYVEIDTGASNNIKGLRKIVQYAMKKDVPYLGINLSLDTCRDCGFSGEIGESCPSCKSTNIQRLRRVTGYITEDYLTAFNDGKIDEVQHRVKHKGIITEVK